MYSALLHLALGATLIGTTPTTSVNAGPSLDTAAKQVANAAPKTQVEVQNTAFNDAVVYAVQGLRRVRLGIVNGLSTQKLTIPRHVVGSSQSIRFIIRPIGARRNSVSEEIVVYEGDTVSLYIPPF